MKSEIKIILDDGTSKAKGNCFEDLIRNLLSIHQYKIRQNIRFTGMELDLLAEHKQRQNEILYVECSDINDFQKAKSMKKIILSIAILFFLNAIGFAQVVPCQITLTSAAGTDAQTLCQSTPITNITYSFSGSSASVVGLPYGVTGDYNGNVFTISGTPVASGTLFNYTITTTDGCAPDAYATGSIATPKTKASFTVNTISGAAPSNVQFKNSSKNTNQYSWNFGDGDTISTQVNPAHIYKSTSLFTVKLVASYNGKCADSTTMNVNVSSLVLGVNALTAIDPFNLFPNPFSNQLSIVTDKPSLVKITTINGTEVYTAKVNTGKSFIDTNGFSTGVYFITITNEQTTVTKKLVKE